MPEENLHEDMKTATDLI